MGSSLVVAGKFGADLDKAVLKRLALFNSFFSDSNMARRYDTRTTIFSPEGRLYQVEYAMEAIGHAGTCLGILASDGIVLAAERRNTNKLLDEVFFFGKNLPAQRRHGLQCGRNHFRRKRAHQ